MHDVESEILSRQAGRQAGRCNSLSKIVTASADKIPPLKPKEDTLIVPGLGEANQMNQSFN